LLCYKLEMMSQPVEEAAVIQFASSDFSLICGLPCIWSVMLYIYILLISRDQRKKVFCMQSKIVTQNSNHIYKVCSTLSQNLTVYYQILKISLYQLWLQHFSQGIKNEVLSFPVGPSSEKRKFPQSTRNFRLSQW